MTHYSRLIWGNNLPVAEAPSLTAFSTGWRQPLLSLAVISLVLTGTSMLPLPAAPNQLDITKVLVAPPAKTVAVSLPVAELNRTDTRPRRKFVQLKEQYVNIDLAPVATPAAPAAEAPATTPEPLKPTESQLQAATSSEQYESTEAQLLVAATPAGSSESLETDDDSMSLAALSQRLPKSSPPGSASAPAEPQIAPGEPAEAVIAASETTLANTNPEPTAIALASPAAADKQAPTVEAETAPLLMLDELEAEQRSYYDSLEFSGHLFSNRVASRFIIVNGKAFAEQETLGADTIVESITTEGAILRNGSTRVFVNIAAILQ